jgi:hypothetical protein
MTTSSAKPKKSRLSAWAWGAIAATIFTLFGLLLPAGENGRGASDAPGNVQCNSVLVVWLNPHAGTVSGGFANPTDREAKYCDGEVALVSPIAATAGSVAIILAGIAVVVTVRRRRRAGVVLREA